VPCDSTVQLKLHSNVSNSEIEVAFTPAMSQQWKHPFNSTDVAFKSTMSHSNPLSTSTVPYNTIVKLNLRCFHCLTWCETRFYTHTHTHTHTTHTTHTQSTMSQQWKHPFNSTDVAFKSTMLHSNQPCPSIVPYNSVS